MRVLKYLKKRLDFSCFTLYLFPHSEMSCHRNGGSEEKEKVGIDILKREGKPPYSLDWWFFLSGMVAIRLLENL
jgi:hypothetical protein